MSHQTRQQRRKASRDAAKQQKHDSRKKMETVVPMSIQEIAVASGLSETEVTQGIKELNAIGVTQLRIDRNSVKGKMQ